MKNDSAGSRGRPRLSGDRDACNELLEAAERCLATKTADQIGIREIASEANLNSAMISYYFGGKEGLFVALYDKLATALCEDLRRIEDRLAVDSPCPVGEMVAVQVDFYYRHASLFNLVRSELLNGESAIFQSIDQGYNARVYQEMLNIVRRMMALGQVGDDLDPQLCAYVIVSLCGHPFVMGPMFEKNSGMALDLELKDRWIHYVSRVVRDHLYSASDDPLPRMVRDSGSSGHPR